MQRLPSRWSCAAAGLLAFFLVGFTITRDRLILTFAEDQQLFSQLEHLAQELPADAPIVMHAHKSWVTPLYATFDRQVIPLDLDSADGQEAWLKWIARCVAAHQPVYMLSEIDDKTASPDDVTLSRTITEPAINQLPERLLTITATFRFVAVDDPTRIVLPPPSYAHPNP